MHGSSSQSDNSPGAAVLTGNSRVRSGFTLVELLVVVAIIALLVSILLPSLNRAKEQARTVMCMTNYKGLSLAFHIYTIDNNDWYPAGSASGGAYYGYTWDSILQPLYENYGLLHCPSDRLNRNVPYHDRLPLKDRHPRSYAINVNVSWMGPSELDDEWPKWVHKATEVTIPAETILLGEMWEAAYWFALRPGVYHVYHGSGIFIGWDRNWPGRGPTLDVHRNEDSANYLFCDGQVITVPADEPKLTKKDNYYYWYREK